MLLLNNPDRNIGHFLCQSDEVLIIFKSLLEQSETFCKETNENYLFLNLLEFRPEYFSLGKEDTFVAKIQSHTNGTLSDDYKLKSIDDVTFVIDAIAASAINCEDFQILLKDIQIGDTSSTHRFLYDVKVSIIPGSSI